MVRLVTKEKPEQIERVPLTGADRCDKCGAQARMRAILSNGDLLFCRHHGQQNMAKLVEIAIDVHVDEPLDA